MQTRLKSCALAVAATLAIAMSPQVATAKDGVSVRIGPGGVGVSIGDHHRHRGPHYSWGPGFYFYDNYYHGDCSWLRQKARETDSRTWWRRYRQCRNG